MSGPAAGAVRGGYRLMIDLMRRYPRHLGWIVVLGLLGSLVLAPAPYLGKIIIDDIIFRQQQGGGVASVSGWLGIASPVWMLALIVSLGVLLKLLGAVLGGWQTYFILQLTRNGLYHLRVEAAERVLGAPMRELETLSPGKVAARLTNDPAQIDGAVFTLLRSCLTAVFTVLVTMGFMLALDPWLTLFVLATMPITALLSIFWYRRLHIFAREDSDRHAALSATTAEIFGSVRVIRAFAAEPAFLDRIRDHAEQLRHKGIRHWTVYGIVGGLLGLLTSLGADIFILVGGVLAIRGQITFGEFFAFSGYQAMLWGPINVLLNTGQTLQQGAASADKLGELLAIPQEPHLARPAQPAAAGFHGDIAAEGLCFSYDGAEDVLHDVNLRIRPGTMTALVGQSGSGKTTFASMLMGLYLPTGGKLLVDGTDIRQWDLRRLREQVGVVLQDSATFDDTVRGNLCLGRTDIPDEWVWSALRSAHLLDVVRDMPQGLDTSLGQAGMRLSGGQRQRLAIARVLLRDPRLVILDEATSADQIVVLHGGRLVECGTHEELVVRRGGRYRDLFQAQVEGMVPMGGATSHRGSQP